MVTLLTLGTLDLGVCGTRRDTVVFVPVVVHVAAGTVVESVASETLVRTLCAVRRRNVGHELILRALARSNGRLAQDQRRHTRSARDVRSALTCAAILSTRHTVSPEHTIGVVTVTCRGSCGLHFCSGSASQAVIFARAFASFTGSRAKGTRSRSGIGIISSVAHTLSGCGFGH